MLESWSIKFLFIVYTLLGVKDIPSSPSHDWDIVERWEMQIDGSYRLQLKSTSMPKICKSNGYVIFPQVYNGLTEILADDIAIFTNATEQRWHLTSLLTRPIINCGYIKNANEITFLTSSKTFYFASIYNYPLVVKEYPASQFFYEQIYLISGLATLILGILGWYFFRKILMENHAHAFLMYNFGVTLLMYAHIPGHISDIAVQHSHSLVFISLNCILVYFTIFTFDKILIRFINKASIAFVLYCVLFFCISHGYPATTQALMVMFMFVAIVGTFGMMMYKIKSGQMIEKVLYILLFIFTVKDCYMSQLTRDGFLYLSIIIVITTSLGFLKVLNLANKKRDEAEYIKIKLFSESKILEKISYANDLHREIIHDLKSPLTALEFNLQSINSGNVREVTGRIKSILNRINSDDIQKNFDWYSFKTMENLVLKIMREKNIEQKLLISDLAGSRLIEVYFDPIALEICISELLDNSIKYSTEVKSLSLSIFEVNDFLQIVVKNIFQKMDNEDDLIGAKGMSRSGSGLGMGIVRKKMSEMGGDFSTEIKDDRFISILKFRKK